MMNMVKIDFDRCKECHYCVKYCQKKILVNGDKINKQGYYTPVVTDMEECIGRMYWLWYMWKSMS